MAITRDQLSAYISEPMSNEDVSQLIEQHIDRDSLGTGVARARIRGTGTSVAAVIDHLGAVEGDAQAAANAFDLTVTQVLAAIFYYWSNQEVIDAEITVRHSYFMD